ncbi:hypothetical protein N7510_006851 [Penicillium lagena]|uniref:uncharacterized protein n=1 Tax=Penicillium lagena TaxID=94218 RepID=UPI0025409DD5|nr:uncharacterized protein N7510_006851 [Penicillium lagena]KAJ5610132.1 hypothetical protein N7510_006851 [Penicillium lagena]
MFAAMLVYLLAGTSMVSTFIVTILNGMFYATLHSMPSHTTTTGLAPVGLSAVSCVALVAISLLFHKDVRSGQRCAGWKTGVFYFTGAYLLFAAGVGAGTMAAGSTAPQKSTLSIARFVSWTFSIFSQGLYCGYLLLASTPQKQSDLQWPRPYLQPSTPSTISAPPAASDYYRFEPKMGSLRKYPRPSSRLSTSSSQSDQTIRPQDTKEAKHSSFNTDSTASWTPEPSPASPTRPERRYDPRPLIRAHNSIRSMPSLRQHRSPAQQSLDSLVRSQSPTGSSCSLSIAETITQREDNIHPLFRSSSPSPSPTPTPGTMVRASPSAGQTITVQTLTRMRSARSLRDQTMRTPSPLPEPDYAMRARKDAGPGLYEKRHELNESPDEN